jgi:hypothetical protein
MFKIKDDMLAHPADGGDAGLFHRRNDVGRRGFQQIRFLPKPHGLDHVSSDALGEAASNRFDFWEFRHGFAAIPVTLNYMYETC